MSASNFGRALLLFGIGLISGIGLTVFSMNESGWWQGETKLEPGVTLFEADINEVRSFSYITTSMTITAQRSKAGGPLAILVTYPDNRPPQYCLSDTGLDGVLSSFALSKVKKQISPKELKLKYPVILGAIEVKDAVSGEPITPWTLFSTNDHSVVAVKKQSDAFEIDISPTALKKLQAGCAALAKR